MQVGSLGDVIFEVSCERVLTPGPFTRERKIRYEQHNVLGALPRLEFLSPDLSTLSLNIRLLLSLGVDPLREFSRLGAMCKEGVVARLILHGQNYGMHVIESYSQGVRHASSQRIISMDVTLNLKEYV